MPHVVFLHPDLGIGGAERAVVDAALALKSTGHTVQFVTAHHNKKHCFDETRDGTLEVSVAGDWLPRNIFGACYALCAYFRMIYAACYLTFFSGINVDIIFCDQISACIPILKLFSKARVLFYCHFPDMLLTHRRNLLKKAYRLPIDWLEEKTTGMADCVLVNSHFTAGVVAETFKNLPKPRVLYPIPDFASLNSAIENQLDDVIPTTAKIIFLSINRYERKKNLGLAIEALDKLRERRGGDLQAIHLVMAGGYDERVNENVEHYRELKELCDRLGLGSHVSFLRSFSGAEKKSLLRRANCLLYTPDREHFGIVPIEAMYLECPVIAVASGGPLETVADKETGFLCEPEPERFAQAMERFVSEPELRGRMGKAGHRRVVEKFSFQTFTQQLDGIIRSLAR